MRRETNSREDAERRVLKASEAEIKFSCREETSDEHGDGKGREGRRLEEGTLAQAPLAALKWSRVGVQPGCPILPRASKATRLSALASAVVSRPRSTSGWRVAYPRSAISWGSQPCNEAG